AGRGNQRPCEFETRQHVSPRWLWPFRSLHRLRSRTVPCSAAELSPASLHTAPLATHQIRPEVYSRLTKKAATNNKKSGSILPISLDDCFRAVCDFCLQRLFSSATLEPQPRCHPNGTAPSTAPARFQVLLESASTAYGTRRPSAASVQLRRS